jgi:3-hydroxyacyl-[acyl-carrier-protein] dehydratase
MSEAETLTQPIEKSTQETPTPVQTVLDINQIMDLIPHRYPFLLIDRIVEMEAKKRIVALKNVTASEPHFAGHFPDYPIMPGVLMIEAMAQTGAVLLMSDLAEERHDKLVVFTGIETAKFRRAVLPGDQLRIEAVTLNWRKTAMKMHGLATVEGKLACEATITCMVVPRAGKGNAK